MISNWFKSFRMFNKANNVRLNRPVGTHLVELLIPEEQFRYGNPNRYAILL